MEAWLLWKVFIRKYQTLKVSFWTSYHDSSYNAESIKISVTRRQSFSNSNKEIRDRRHLSNLWMFSSCDVIWFLTLLSRRKRFWMLLMTDKWCSTLEVLQWHTCTYIWMNAHTYHTVHINKMSNSQNYWIKYTGKNKTLRE